MRLFSAFLTFIVASGVLAAERPDPRLVTVETDGARQLWVEVDSAGTTVRRLVRETDAVLVPGETGSDPTGRAVFATWTEGGRPWSSYSRNAGDSWSRAKPLRTELRLVAGTVRPGSPMPEPAEGLALPEDRRLFIVQLKTVSLPEWRAGLEAQGAELLTSLAHNAHIVRADPSAVGGISNLDFVERAEPYHPSYRLEPELLSRVGDSTGSQRSDEGPMRVRVVAFEWGPAGKDRIARAARGLGAVVAENWPDGHVVELWVEPHHLQVLAAHDDVMWIDRWTPRETDMDLVREAFGTNWVEDNFGYCGEGVRGEVLDEGIRGTHQDFDGVMFHGAYNVASHGTATYGIVFGNGDRDGDGSAQATGQMPCDEAQGIFADFNDLGNRFSHTQELKQSPYFASFQSNSWGNSRTTSYTSVSQELDDIIWRLDIAITQSQSNAGTQSSRPQAWAKNVISVGGIRHLNNLDPADDYWGGGASIGPASDGRIKPDLHGFYDSIYTTTSNNDQAYTSSFCCTSAATPQVAGVIGLMIQMWSDNVWGTDPTGTTVFERQPHFSTIKALAINNAFQYLFSGTSSDLTRTHQGWGRPSARIAKERAAASLVVDETERLQLGETVSYDVAVDEGEAELKITMTYPDPPGVPLSSVHRINDVNLKVTSPSDVVYHGNVGLLAGPYSSPGGSPDPIDTVENVFIESPEPGIWRIEIEAAEVNQDGYLATPEEDVTFALVVTGAITVPGECGNGIREVGEQCDGADLGDANCATDGGCLGGPLSCTMSCTLDFAACTGCPTCDDDGVCEIFEDCSLCPGDCPAVSLASCGNNICETADGENCENCPDDCNSVTTGGPAGRYCCSDGTGVSYPITCVDGRCDTGGNTCISAPAPTSCCGDRNCEGVESLASCFPDCAPDSPGEAASPLNGSLTVTGFDEATGVISLDYGVACQATTHTIEYAELTRANLESYGWSGQECDIGASGTHDWSTAGLPGSIFFVVVAQDGSSSGSYGTDSRGLERLEDSTATECPAPQDLFRRCD
jgi:hypothetical protein